MVRGWYLSSLVLDIKKYFSLTKGMKAKRNNIFVFLDDVICGHPVDGLWLEDSLYFLS